MEKKEYQDWMDGVAFWMYIIPSFLNHLEFRTHTLLSDMLNAHREDFHVIIFISTGTRNVVPGSCWI